MVPRYALQLLFSEKIQNPITQQPLKLDINIWTNLEYLEFKKYFDECVNKFKSNNILLNKISHRYVLTTTLL
jgi:hypothetical protein